MENSMAVDVLVETKPENKPVHNSPLKKIRNPYWGVQFKLFVRALKKRKVSFRKLWNVFLCDLFFLFKITKGSPHPYILSLEPWNECNAGCLFCRDKKGTIHDLNPLKGGISKGKMPAEMAMDIISQVKDDIL